MSTQHAAHERIHRPLIVQKETPLDRAELLSKSTGNNVWLKREDLQPVFSFKLRGAYNKMASLPKSALEKGVICSSAGNHAQGVALAAQRLGASSVICMPVNTPTIKVQLPTRRTPCYRRHESCFLHSCSHDHCRVLEQFSVVQPSLLLHWSRASG